MSKQLRTLIVEDSEDDALLIVKELKRGGYDPSYERVDTAAGMSIALSKQEWDVMLVDHSMPHFSAPAALNLMKKRGLDLPFIIVSGTLGENNAVKAIKAGAHDYLTRDNLKRLAPAVKREMKEAAARRRHDEKELVRYRRRLEELVAERTAELAAANRKLHLDIEKRKGIEERLRFTEFSVERSAVATYWLDSQARVLHVNDAACKALGCSREEILTMTVHDFDPDYPRQSWDTFWENLKERGHLIIEARHRARNGRVFPVEIEANYFEYGDEEYCFSFARDITERKQAEQEIKAAHDKLERKVRERTAGLSKANDELNAKIAERKRVEREIIQYHKRLRSLASESLLAEERERKRISMELHDRIGQPLLALKLMVGSLREFTHSAGMTEALDKIDNLIGGTIDDARTLTFELSPHVLYMLGLEAAIEWLAEKSEKRYGVSFQYESDHKPKPMDEDLKVFLFQAIRELMANVGKHARAANAKVTVRRNNGTLSIGVEDDGVGFNVSELDSIRGGNVGFGLFSIRERLYHLGGSFEITSKSGAGTKIRLTAPMKAPTGTERRETTPA